MLERPIVLNFPIIPILTNPFDFLVFRLPYRVPFFMLHITQTVQSSHTSQALQTR